MCGRLVLASRHAARRALLGRLGLGIGDWRFVHSLLWAKAAHPPGSLSHLLVTAA